MPLHLICPNGNILLFMRFLQEMSLKSRRRGSAKLSGFVLVMLVGFCTCRRGQEDAVVIVQGSVRLAETDENYICATMDWWPPEKCNYNQCPWGQSSILNLDIYHPLLVNAIQAFRPLRIRLGGSLQDQVLYDEPDSGYPCQPFKKVTGGLFGFSEGCLSRHRWDEINVLFQKTGALVTFGLNALRGRHIGSTGLGEGALNFSNARNFIKYTISKGYPVDSWELGNELSGRGIGARVSAQAYGKDLIGLRRVLNELYKGHESYPALLAPGGFYDQLWYGSVLDYCGPHIIDGMTHHIYNLGAGDDPHLIDRILNPSYLSQAANTFRDLQRTIQRHGPSSVAWVSEAGGAYNSGGKHVSDTFANTFWYVDQLGLAAEYDTKVYCRQSLVGGNYGLLDTTSFVPNPDYYSALLWHRLMGKTVLSVDISAPPSLRVYAHCAKQRTGISMVFINLDSKTEFSVDVRNDLNIVQPKKGDDVNVDSSFVRGLKKTFSWVGRGNSYEDREREEYHLTGKDGDYRSRFVLLNDSPLELTDSGDIPEMNPLLSATDSPVAVAPLSIVFVVLPYFEAAACS